VEPFVLGVLLKVETRGWRGPPPSLPKPPVKVDEGRDELKTFIYDLSPKDADVSVSDACLRIASRLERMLTGPKSPFPEGHYAIRCTLEFGVMADREAESFGYAWPLEFLQAVVDCGVELRVSHYLPKPDDDGDGDDEDF
jgi:hypothetical protein